MKRATVAASCCALIAALATGAGAEVGESPDRGTWVTDGPVYSIARLGDRTFVGGHFSYVGRRSGPGVQLAPAGAAGAGSPSPDYGSFPEVAGGRVLAVTPDAGGGWFVGGDFSHVGGVARSGLARLVPDATGALTVDPGFDPQVSGAVRALALGATIHDDDVLYFGGAFDALNGDTKYRNFAALHASDGTPAGLWPAPDGTVTAISSLPQRDTATGYPVIVLGGEFTKVGAAFRTGLAAIWGVGAGEGLQAGVTPFAEFDAFAGVKAVEVGQAKTSPTDPNQIGAPVYVGGNLGLAAFKLSVTAGPTGPTVTGAPYGTWPNVACDTQASPGCVPRVRALEAAPDGQTLYAGGRFDTVGGEDRSNAVALTGIQDVHAPALPVAVRSWKPEPNGPVRALAASDGSAVYAGGDFTQVAGVDRLGLAALSPSGATTALDPNDALVLNDWDPRVAGGIPGSDAGVVNALAVSSGAVYAGGSFTAAGATRHDNVAAFDAGGALIDTWAPSADGAVFALAAGNDRVYLGGLFGSVDGQTRTRLAAVSATDGTLSSGFAPPAEPECSGTGCGAPAPGVLSLALTDQTLYVGGSFAWLGGAERRNAGAVHATDGTALPWTPDPDGTVYSLLATCGEVYAGGAFSTAGGQARSRIASFDPQTGIATDWNPSANAGAVFALARDVDVVYAGGSFATIGGTERKRIAALDAETGIATTWSPSVPGTGDFVRALAVPPGGSTVYAGGQITSGGTHTYVAAFDRATGSRNAWEARADAPVRALAPAGDALLLGGEFRRLGAQMQQGFGSFGLATAGTGGPLSCAPPEPEPEPEPVVELPPEPEPPAPRPVEPYRDTLAPVLGPVRLTNARFRTARILRAARVSRRRRAPVGTRFRYRLSEPAVLRFTFLRRQRVKCQSRSARRACYRWRKAGRLAHLSRAGSVAAAFRGKVGRRWLRPGRYRVRIRAIDPAGNRSARQRRTFTIVRR